MPCVTCNHTVQGVGRNEQGFHQFWCPRCGSVKTENGEPDKTMTYHESWEVPRWVRLLLAGEWHQVQAELLDNKRLRDALEELKRTSPVEIKR